MASIPYNPWYDATYDEIRGMADWSRLDADVMKKMVCIYSWMPCTLMSVKHTGGSPRWVTYPPDEVEAVLHEAARPFAPLARLSLVRTSIDPEIETSLIAALDLVFPAFGSVAASKYLHFSAPRFVPMWDGTIRDAREHDDTPRGFLEYMYNFKDELAMPENLEAARAAYPRNPVRGWDIANMRNRLKA